MGKKFQTLSLNTIKALQRYPWPGNVRELENLVERAVITSSGSRLHIDVSVLLPPATAKMRTLENSERKQIVEVLEHTYWKVEGSDGAAKLLGLNPSTLRQRMRKYGIRKPSFKP